MGVLTRPRITAAALHVLFLGAVLRRVFGGARTLDAREARRLLDERADVVVVDVRKDGEFRGGHLPRAKHIPVGLVPARSERLDPEATYLLYCRSGSRSAKAADALVARGFKHVHKLHGGILAWERHGYPVEKRK